MITHITIITSAIMTIITKNITKMMILMRQKPQQRIIVLSPHQLIIMISHLYGTLVRDLSKKKALLLVPIYK